MKLPLIALFTAICLTAQQTPIPAPANSSKHFNKLDKDHDGRLSLNEFQAAGKNPARRAKRFGKLDTNHDGYLSPEEFAAGMPAPSQTR